MGEIVEAMLNGELCYGCGCYIETKPEQQGQPIYCSYECRDWHDLDVKYPYLDNGILIDHEC